MFLLDMSNCLTHVMAKTQDFTALSGEKSRPILHGDVIRANARGHVVQEILEVSGLCVPGFHNKEIATICSI